MKSVVGNIIQHAGMGLTGRVSGQDVNVNPELNELSKHLCTILIFDCILCLDCAKVIWSLLQSVIKA